MLNATYHTTKNHKTHSGFSCFTADTTVLPLFPLNHLLNQIEQIHTFIFTELLLQHQLNLPCLIAYPGTSCLQQLIGFTIKNFGQLKQAFDGSPNIATFQLQRDLNERLGFLSWNEHGSRWYSLDKTKLGHLYPQDIERFARFCSIQDLLPEIDRKLYQEHLTQIMQIKGFQYEDIKLKQADFDLVHQAIEQQHRIQFNYRKAGQDKGKYYTLEPYSLLNCNGIWDVIRNSNAPPQNSHNHTARTMQKPANQRRSPLNDSW